MISFPFQSRPTQYFFKIEALLLVLKVKYTLTSSTDIFLEQTNTQSAIQRPSSLVSRKEVQHLFNGFIRHVDPSMVPMVWFYNNSEQRKWLAIRCKSVVVVLEEDMHDNANVHITYYRPIVDPCNNAPAIAHNNDVTIVRWAGWFCTS